MQNVNLKKLFLYLLVASVAFSAVVGIVVVLLGNFGDFEIRVLMTTLTVTVTSILGLACGAYIETKQGRILPTLGIVLSIVSAIMLFFVIWDVMDDSKGFIKTVLTTILLAASCSHLSLLSIARLGRRFAWSRIAAFIFVWLLAGVLLFLLWVEPKGNGDAIARVIGVLSILIAAVTVITPVFHKLSLRETATDDIDAQIEKLLRQIEKLEEQKTRRAER